MSTLRSMRASCKTPNIEPLSQTVGLAEKVLGGKDTEREAVIVVCASARFVLM